MKFFIDGNQLVIIKDDFIDLQESPAVFVPRESETGQAIQVGGVLNVAIGDLYLIQDLLNNGGGDLYAIQGLLNSGGGEFGSVPADPDPAYAEYNKIREQAGLSPLR